MYPKNNPESWQRIHEFVDWFSDDDPHWSRWKPMVRRVLLELEQRGLVSLFRAGQSMHHIMFSTLDHHGLETEPRVTLEMHVERGLVRVAYSTANLYFCEPLAEEYAPVEGATAATLAFLRRLWIETKAGQPLPDALRG